MGTWQTKQMIHDSTNKLKRHCINAKTFHNTWHIEFILWQKYLLRKSFINIGRQDFLIDFLIKKKCNMYKELLSNNEDLWIEKSSWHLTLSSMILSSVYMENVSPIERFRLSLAYFFLKKKMWECEDSLVNSLQWENEL